MIVNHGSSHNVSGLKMRFIYVQNRYKLEVCIDNNVMKYIYDEYYLV